MVEANPIGVIQRVAAETSRQCICVMKFKWMYFKIVAERVGSIHGVRERSHSHVSREELLHDGLACVAKTSRHDVHGTIVCVVIDHPPIFGFAARSFKASASDAKRNSKALFEQSLRHDVSAVQREFWIGLHEK